jgi:hypothetical protein
MPFNVPILTPFLERLSTHEVDVLIASGAVIGATLSVGRFLVPRLRSKHEFSRHQVARQALNGGTFVMFLLLTLSAVAPGLLLKLATNNPGAISMAGLMGVIFAFGEVIDGQ